MNDSPRRRAGSRASWSEDPAPECATLVDLLSLRAEVQPDDIGYIFVTDGATVDQQITYAELDREARQVAAYLQACGLAGDRVLLVFQPGLDYLRAFFGCLYAGAVAVPTYPPRRNRSDARLDAIVADSRAEALLTSGDIAADLGRLSPHAADLQSPRVLTLDECLAAEPDDWLAPPSTGNTLAFLQYTSGSTTVPRGVMVSHGNLLSNQRWIKRCFRHDAGSTYVSWLPLYHDMGLIGCVLQPLYLGSLSVLMRPTDFLQQPARWLQAISRFRAYTSGAPDFAYDLCVRLVTDEQTRGLDLSSWSNAFNGAEPVRAETLRRFADRFSRFGFRPEAFLPCYGLAEATLLVTGKPAEEPPAVVSLSASDLLRARAVPAASGAADSRDLVGCGRASPDHTVAIVDPVEHRVCPPDRVGEIWIGGPSVAQGYWNRLEETVQTFQARLADEPEAGPFLRTGDLGVWSSGQLCITGRIKDLIIIRGRNHYPQDVEATVEGSHRSLRPRAGAAFSVEEGGEERLVVVHEVERTARLDLDVEAVATAVRRAVADEHELQVHCLALIRPGGLPRTSSGKVERRTCRARYLAGDLPLLGTSVVTTQPTAPTSAAQSPPPSALTSAVLELVSGIVGVPAADLAPGQPLTYLGLDSVMALRLVHALEAEFGLSLPVETVLDSLSVDDVVAEIRARLRGQPSALPDTAAVVGSAPAPIGGTEATSELPAPLSYGQEAQWFLYRLAPESGAYNGVAALQISAEVDPAALGRALRVLVSRHPVLRTTYADAEGGPVQRCHAEPTVDFQAVDALNLDQFALERYLLQEGQRPFDLEHGPVLRARLAARPSGESVLLIALHHIAFDGHALRLLIQELGALLAAERQQTRVLLPELPSTYRDFAERERAWMASPEAERQVAYWRTRLSGGLPVLDLPIDRPRGTTRLFSGGSHCFHVDEPLVRRLRDLAAAQRTTIYVTLLTAFAVFLHRASGQDDLIVGSAFSTRDASEFDGVVGSFVNTVALRAGLSGDPSVGDAVRRFRAIVLKALANKEYPFPLLVRQLHLARDPSRSPVFQAVFAFQPFAGEDDPAAHIASGGTFAWGGLQAYPLDIPQEEGQYDLALEVIEGKSALAVHLKYDASLFESSTIACWAASFQTLLAGIVDDPDCPISRLPLLSADERQRILVDWNATSRPLPEATLGDLFQAQVARTPAATALIAGNERITFQELRIRINRLRRFLESLGIGPGVLVGVCLERSPDLITTLLAVLEAGGAYLPLDPTYPPERLAYMLDDAHAEFLVSRGTLTRVLPPAWSERAVDLDAAGQHIAGQSPDSFPCSASPSDLAYVLYTSGSTGRPKGVAVEHRAVVALLEWAREEFTPEERAGVLASSSACFDSSVFEMFLPLCWGGELILAENLFQLPTLPAADEVRLISTVTSGLAQLFRAGGLPSGVLALQLGGEVLPAALVQSLYSETGVRRIFNAYGPTEDTTVATAALAPRDSTEAPNIGRPIANGRAFVLDRHLQPVPVGLRGHLYLGGAGLARGYLNRPELTAERFIPSPFDPLGRERLYQTGDLARFRADGAIEFLGRSDRQVKVRGYRIELGEVEACLGQHPEVASAVISVRSDHQGNPRMVAYVAPVPGSGLRASALRPFLAQKLPEFMLPAAFVLLERLPLTTSGKVDYRALPESEDERPDLVAAYVAPATRTEAILASLWQEILGIRRVGIDDNFFELGGHSLLLLQIHARLEATFVNRLAVLDLFRYPTVRRLAAYLDGAPLASGSSPRAEARGEGRDRLADQRERRRQSRSRGTGGA